MECFEGSDFCRYKEVVVPALEAKISSMVDLLNLIRDNLDPDNSLCDAIEDVIGERA
ncbi:hypothetical protein LCGC14_1680920 [marine sediment metagenome]|uniref:Uncharacterized protein n=1 Tax=marine sediment metagenome TaxID=412755 RepID=A0A0F9K4C3_9ZZZZ